MPRYLFRHPGALTIVGGLAVMDLIWRVAGIGGYVRKKVG